MATARFETILAAARTRLGATALDARLPQPKGTAELAATPDDLAFFRFTRVDDFVAQVAAVRTLHAVFPCSA